MNREEKKVATRKKILESALKLFAEQGYEATTVMQITEHAGVAKGTFFNYFKTKEDLFCDLQGFFAAEEVAKLKDKPGPITPRLKALAAEVVSRMNLTRSLARALFQGTLTSAASLDNQVCQLEELREALTPVFAIGQERGEFTKQMPPEMLAQMAVQTYFGVLISWCLEQGDDNLTEQTVLTFELFFKGISA